MYCDADGPVHQRLLRSDSGFVSGSDELLSAILFSAAWIHLLAESGAEYARLRFDTDHTDAGGKRHRQVGCLFCDLLRGSYHKPVDRYMSPRSVCALRFDELATRFARLDQYLLHERHEHQSNSSHELARYHRNVENHRRL